MTSLDMNSKIRLNSGHYIPRLGYGVYQTPAAVAEDVCDHAIKSGYRHVDSATMYRNEEPSAKGMLKSGVPRDQLYFTSKVPPKEVTYEGAKKAVEESLQKTGLGYIDLYLIHAPYGGTDGRLGAWKALVEAVDAGKVKSIGVSNYGVQHLDELEQWQKQQPEGQGGILSVNQVELHPWLARDDIVRWCESRGVVLEAYSPLVRATRMDDPLLQPLVKKHNKKASQILLRWSLQKNFVILPKSETHSRIEENRSLYDFELSKEDMESLKTGKYEPCAWDPTIEPLSK
ncbi:related to 2,5-diketo-D-gluconic acid reductase [Ramularia collo-cygni]|uniref:Related to 2,5-diketo-D-gluconic acid reductase n=1 Tax=Ramularia collo-cygni TaxID=112498 RepID=A0A2D3VJZ8_9PEZI|nr:related to 2,5-diketo-D-gluconic acid reductase [Ramularia collo-cygni]CZT22449.1 related to 2,5-diketo-D-gluconic acid reductase [Ramularia collo-cygni]